MGHPQKPSPPRTMIFFLSPAIMLSTEAKFVGVVLGVPRKLRRVVTGLCATEGCREIERAGMTPRAKEVVPIGERKASDKAANERKVTAAEAVIEEVNIAAGHSLCAVVLLVITLAVCSAMNLLLSPLMEG